MQRLQQTATSQSTSPTLFDQETARQILARATELEQQKSDQLTADQIEALGRELGLDPQAVRRAIGERVGELGETQTQRAGTARSKLTIRSIWQAGVPFWCLLPVATLVMYLIVITYPQIAPTWVEVLAGISTLVVPVVAAFWNGRRVRDWRLGTIAGGAGSTLLYVAVYIAIGVATNNWPPNPGGIILFLVGMVALTAGAGALGAATGEEKVQMPAVLVSARDTDR